MAGMRIWYQSMAPITNLPAYTDALKAHAARVCSEGVEIVFNGASDALYKGRMPADLLKYPYGKLVLQAEAIHFCQQAERDGFDAVILGSFSEPFLPEIRSVVDIPVASMAESAMLTACSLAEQFTLVSLAPAYLRRLRTVIRRHAMEPRLAGTCALAQPVDEAILNAAFARPDAVVADFTAVAKRAVAAGADLVIPAEGVLNEVLYAAGVRAVGDAPVMDSVGVVFLHAEYLVTLKRRTGLGVSRRFGYAKPPPDILAELNALAFPKRQS